MKQLILALFSFCVFASAGISQDEATAASLYNDGLAAMKAKDYSTAYDLMQQALAKADPEADAKVLGLANKNGAIAAYYHGNALKKEEKIDEAMEAHNKGIEMNGDFYGNYVGLAKIHITNGQSTEAVKAYLTAGQLRTKEGKADKAQSYFNNIDKIIARAYSKKNYDETIAAADVVIEGNETAEAHYYKAKALIAAAGSKEEALTHALKSHDLGGDEKESKYVFAVAEIYEASGKKSKAIQYYKNVSKGKYYDLAQYKVNQSQ